MSLICLVARPPSRLPKPKLNSGPREKINSIGRKNTSRTSTELAKLVPLVSDATDAARNYDQSEHKEGAVMKAQRIVLEVHICDQRRSYKVVFTGTDSQIDANVAAFWEARKTYCAMWDWSEKQPTVDSERHPITFNLLYPICEHGLSGLLCSGPHHYAEPGTPGWD